MVSASCITALLCMRLQRSCLSSYNAKSDSCRLLKFCYMCTGSQFFITLVRAFLSVLLTHWETSQAHNLCIMRSICISNLSLTRCVFLICAGTYATSGWQAR